MRSPDKTSNKQNMNILKIDSWFNFKPGNFTGRVENTKLGDTAWYKDGMYHNENGPAIISRNGNLWFLNGAEFTEEKYRQKIRRMKLKLLKSKGCLKASHLQ